MDFQRLREKRYAQASKRYDKTTFNKVIHPINSQLAKLWRLRGSFTECGSVQATANIIFRILNNETN